MAFFAAALATTASSAKVRANDGVVPQFADIERRADAETTYVVNALAIVHVGADPNIDGPGSTWRPVRGIYRLSLHRDEFYGVVGLWDLATEQARARSIAEGLRVGGLVLMAGGVVATAWLMLDHHERSALVGVSAVVAGFVLFQVVPGPAGPSVSEARAFELANQYNARLRAHLGLTSTPAPEVTAPPMMWPRRHALTCAPLVTRLGGGIVFGGQM